ncbi:PVC-type heme-binding CxxCH protein [uncultured Arcticibacterium sp.]|uniref:PVC-type heme-binding CxxCH protein n=1 Tax=uncultured Arcticibacterium sp. TaxID=2173042 RepID=UPI0030F9116A
MKKLILLFSLFLLIPKLHAQSNKVDRDYFLEASMLGYFAKDGTRNPTLKANEGDVVRITITNAETMTHDIAMEKLGIKSSTLNEKGSSTSITFTAVENDTYFCTVPGHKAAGMVGKFEVVEGSLKQAIIAGIYPTKDGKPLNLNFETGTLKDWTAEGAAFKEPIFSQNTSGIYEEDKALSAEGKYFISSGGSKHHDLKGTLTSTSFLITEPYAAFSISGGALADTRVELVLKDNDEIIFSSTGQGRSNLQPVVVDLRSYFREEMFIRIIDNETGVSPISYIGKDKWAHINFDNFLFYSERPSFPNELNQEDIIVMPPLDPILNSGLSGQEAVKAMTIPEGFAIKLAASEPDVIRPICFTIDPKGRLWVVEAHTYPTPAPKGEGKDRILILEDTDGDGTLDKKKIFMDGLNLVSGIEIGMGGLWLGAAPNFLFVPVDFETDKPTEPPQVLLDGWGTQDTHEVLNSFHWGPDGWLYGTHGLFTHSEVGKPNTPKADRIKINGGVWRYHPTRHEFEVFAHGTSNPWGLDFNNYGHPFITVCVIPHMFHVIQGARYQRQAHTHFNPYTYDDIKTIGDHVHYLGDRGPHAGNFRSAAAGGGHAHSGAMIYLGGSNWPEKYHNNIFMNNINGAKMNVDELRRNGSGYLASHQKDFITMNDSWSQWLNFKYDASGSVWAIDWYDQNQCHSPNPDVHDKSLGRIFKIAYEGDQWVQVDLSKATDMELVNYQLHENEWYVRTARTLLQERGGSPEVHAALKEILKTNPDISRKLRALWTLHVTDGISEEELNALLTHKDENLRSWAIQLLTEQKTVSVTTLELFENIAKKDESPLVRLYLTSAMMRLAPEERWKAMEILIQKEQDADDHNLPLMYWYCIEPLAELDASKALDLSEKAKVPNLLKYMIKRVAAMNSTTSKQVLKNLYEKWTKSDSHQHHAEMMLMKELLN